jgi:hypothetical protein
MVKLGILGFKRKRKVKIIMSLLVGFLAHIDVTSVVKIFRGIFVELYCLFSVNQCFVKARRMEKGQPFIIIVVAKIFIAFSSSFLYVTFFQLNCFHVTGDGFLPKVTLEVT